MRVIIVRVDGTTTAEDVPGYRGLKQALDGGDLEIVRFARDLLAYIDGHGKDKGLTPNLKATALAQELDAGLLPGDYLAGTAVFVGPPDYNGDDTDVPTRWLPRLLEA
jgi:hypothetical protein